MPNAQITSNYCEIGIETVFGLTKHEHFQYKFYVCVCFTYKYVDFHFKSQHIINRIDFQWNSQKPLVFRWSVYGREWDMLDERG